MGVHRSQKRYGKLGMVTHACNPITQEAEAGVFPANLDWTMWHLVSEPIGEKGQKTTC